MLSPRHGRPGPHKFGTVAWQRRCSSGVGVSRETGKGKSKRKREEKESYIVNKGKLYVIV